MNQTASKRLFWILLATPFFKPALLGVLEGTDFLETCFDLWRMAAAGVIVLLYLYEMIRQRRKPTAVLLWLCAYLGFVGLSTVLHGSNYWAILNHVVTIVSFCMLLELSLRRGPMVTLDMLFYPLTVLILANFILECLYPGGICTGGTYYYSYNLLGIDNLLAPILIPYMFLHGAAFHHPSRGFGLGQLLHAGDLHPEPAAGLVGHRSHGAGRSAGLSAVFLSAALADAV